MAPSNDEIKITIEKYMNQNNEKLKELKYQKKVIAK